MRLTNTKIVARLALGFGLIIVLGLVMIGVGIRALEDAKANLFELDARQHIATLIQQWNADSRLNFSHLMAVTKASRASEVVDYFNPQISKTSERISELQKIVTQSITNEADRAQLEEIAKSRTAYRNARDEYLKALKAGNADAPALADKMVPIAEKYFSAVTTLGQSVSQSASSRMAGALNSSEQVFIGVGVLILLVAVAIGVVTLLEHSRLLQQLQQLASVDVLTGCMMRRVFFERAEVAVSVAQRSGHPFTIAMLDIDFFKKINDVYGHATGDRVLANFAAIINKNLRASDILARFGGEEFVVLCPDTSIDEAATIFNRLCLIVANQFCETDSEPVTVTFSAGLEQYRFGETLTELLARADAALYEAKRAGRNRVAVAGQVAA